MAVKTTKYNTKSLVHNWKTASLRRCWVRLYMYTGSLWIEMQLRILLCHHFLIICVTCPQMAGSCIPKGCVIWLHCGPCPQWLGLISPKAVLYGFIVSHVPNGWVLYPQRLCSMSSLCPISRMAGSYIPNGWVIYPHHLCPMSLYWLCPMSSSVVSYVPIGCAHQLVQCPQWLCPMPSWINYLSYTNRTDQFRFTRGQIKIQCNCSTLRKSVGKLYACRGMISFPLMFCMINKCKKHLFISKHT
jgi:hypothetical protein